MEKQFEVFEYLSKEVRVAFKEAKDGTMEPWFNLGDLCKVLELENASMVAKRIRDHHLCSIKGVVKSGTRRDGSTYEQTEYSTFVDETGLYVCVMRSRRQEAQDFLYYVCEDVLPELRKTGGYLVGMENLNVEEKAAVEAELRELREKYDGLKTEYETIDNEYCNLFKKVKKDFGLEYIYGTSGRDDSGWVLTKEGFVTRRETLAGER